MTNALQINRFRKSIGDATSLKQLLKEPVQCVRLLSEFVTTIPEAVDSTLAFVTREYYQSTGSESDYVPVYTTGTAKAYALCGKDELLYVGRLSNDVILICGRDAVVQGLSKWLS